VNRLGAVRGEDGVGLVRGAAVPGDSGWCSRRRGRATRRPAHPAGTAGSEPARRRGCRRHRGRPAAARDGVPPGELGRQRPAGLERRNTCSPRTGPRPNTCGSSGPPGFGYAGALLLCSLPLAPALFAAQLTLPLEADDRLPATDLAPYLNIDTEARAAFVMNLFVLAVLGASTLLSWRTARQRVRPQRSFTFRRWGAPRCGVQSIVRSVFAVPTGAKLRVTDVSPEGTAAVRRP
jgi:hypothetical protein